MKRVNNSDINFLLNPKLVNLANFTIKFYTTSPESFYIQKTQDDLIVTEREMTVEDMIENGLDCGDVSSGATITEYWFKLEWEELKTIGEGVLEFRGVNILPDDDRIDNNYKQYFQRSTDYYIDSNVIVDPDQSESYAQLLAELDEKIDEEIVRSISADTELLLELNQETATRQQNVSDLTDLITSASTEIATLSGNVYTKDEVDELIDNINLSGYTTIEEFEEACEVTAAALNDLNDRKLDASAYTPTDLSNYYTKSETSGASQISTALDDKLDITAYTPTDLSNYYTKSEVYNKTEIDNKFDNINLSGYVETNAFTAYSASVATVIENDELATSEAINDINSRIINIVGEIDNVELATSEAINDLNSRVINIVDNTYSKTEVDNLINSIDTSQFLAVSAFTAYSAATEQRISALEAKVNDLETNGVNAGDY